MRQNEAAKQRSFSPKVWEAGKPLGAHPSLSFSNVI